MSEPEVASGIAQLVRLYAGAEPGKTFMVPLAEARAIENDLVREVLVLAGQLAWVKRLIQYRDKGRKPTKRAIEQWRRTKLRPERRAWIDEAAGLSGRHSNHPLLRWVQIQQSLRILIEIAVDRKPGRKAALRPGGLLAQAGPPVRRSSDKGPGRPRSHTDEDDRRWLTFIYGRKLAIYEERKGVRKSGSVDDAIRRLLRDPCRDPEMTPTKWLDETVPDTIALARERAQQRLHGSPTALARRLQRVRQREHYILRGTHSKSGGS